MSSPNGYSVRIQTVSENGRQTTERRADNFIEALALAIRNHADEIPGGIERAVVGLAYASWFDDGLIVLEDEELARWEQFREAAKKVFPGMNWKGEQKR